MNNALFVLPSPFVIRKVREDFDIYFYRAIKNLGVLGAYVEAGGNPDANGRARAGVITGVDRIATNVWLVDMHKNPEVLNCLIEAASMFDVPYKVKYFDDQRGWLPDGHRVPTGAAVWPPAGGIGGEEPDAT